MAYRTTIDNAVTAAFREVLGWCPERDGVPPGTRIYLHVGDETLYEKSTERVSPIPKAYVQAERTMGVWP